MKNIAILLTDISYDYESSFNNINEYIIEPLLKNNYEDKNANINCFLTHSDFYDINSRNELVSLTSKYNINILDMDYYHSINCIENYDKFKKTVDNFPYYQYKWFLDIDYSLNEIKNYSIDNNFNYDYIIILSLKNIFNEKITIPSEIEDNNIYILKEKYEDNIIYDNIFGTISTLKKFYNFDNLINLILKNNNIKDPFTNQYARYRKNIFLNYIIESEKIKLKKFDFTFELDKPKYKKKVTNINDIKEGFGETFKIIIQTIIFCEYYGYDFYYSPINHIDHNYDNDPEFINKKEILMNIKSHYKLSSENENYEIVGQFELITFFNINIDFLLKSKEIENLKNIFRENKKNRFNPKFNNIAIHIRRMNKHDIENIKYAKQYEGTDVSNNVYLHLISQIRSIYNSWCSCLFHIYSQGKIEDFKELELEDVVFHLNESIEDTYTDLVFADTLITAPSAFSYTSALLSNGCIFYIKYCEPKLQNWNRINDYVSTRRYMQFIKKSDTYELKVIYEPYLGLFYKENKDLTKTYFKVHDVL